MHDVKVLIKTAAIGFGFALCCGSPQKGQVDQGPAAVHYLTGPIRDYADSHGAYPSFDQLKVEISKNKQYAFLLPTSQNWLVEGHLRTQMQARRASEVFIGKGVIEYSPVKNQSGIIAGCILRKGDPETGKPVSSGSYAVIFVEGDVP